ncbi:hypothetical protein CXB51_029308 [Gossypium anomalum]|uniref:Integrase catalytic domain-containing protein n=1 Tax=Gossypium anomalum TaxID=47600 RepID=A0A8J6CTW4_9ROSI|nr:hypothetical protein CXB51_029308 [Gossypium anomalum]
MASYERLFKNLNRSFTSKVRVGNGNPIEAKGKGDAVISTHLGNKVIFDVLYVLDIDQNLLSVGQLIEKGYSLLFKNDSCVVEDAFGQILVTVAMTDRLNLVEDMSKIEVSDDVCEVCQLALVENQSGCKIKALRSDNGIEYLSKKFQKLCEQAGIHHKLTIVYTPQQNGVCERKNRTILDMARCLLFESKLPSKFWAEAANTLVYLLNRLPTTAVKDKTPFEVWHDLKPTVSHLKVFSCVCYTLILAEKRSKLDKRSMPGIFVGYSSTNKGYRVYDPSTKKILVSRDVRFNEGRIWSWNDADARLTDEDQLENSLELAEEGPADEDFDEESVRGTRTIADIYQRCNVTIVEHSNFEEAAKNKNWKKAIEAELEMIHKNDTWDLVDRPDHKKVIGVKWAFRAKYNADGSLNKHKARLVVKGYSQQYGIYFMETFAPVARLDTIKLLFSLAAQKQWRIHQLDVKSAFLNGFLKEEIFIEQLEGFKVPSEEDKVYKLKKALYGLKQAPKAWYDRVCQYLSKLGFEKSVSEPTLFIKKSENETLLIVSLYVDDLLVTRSKGELIDEFKVQMQKVFEMLDLRVMTYFLSMEVNQSDQCIFISQHAFALKILSRFCMTNCKIVSTPVIQGEKLTSCGNQERVDGKEYRSLVGCLLYLTATRPDIMYAVSLLFIFMHYCDVVHFKAAKRVLRYLKGTLNHGVNFEKAKELKLIGYSDSDWAGSIDDMKSTSGYFFTLGSGVFCWSSKKQQTNPVFHGKTKHFKIKYHFVREEELSKEINLVHCCSEVQLADILTKPLAATRFEYLKKQIGVYCFVAKEEC